MTDILNGTMHSGSRRFVRLAGSAGLAGLFMLSGNFGAQAQEVTPQAVNGFQHFSDCLHVLLSNSDLHAQYCSPSLILPDTKSLSDGGGGKSAGPVLTDDDEVPPG